MRLWRILLGGGGEAVAKPVKAPGNEDEVTVGFGAEAAGSSLFATGWRPAIGWVCAVALAAYYIPRFVVGTVLWVVAAWGQPVLPPMPEMGIGDILGLVGSLLGMSWLRTAEKKAGVAR